MTAGFTFLLNPASGGGAAPAAVEPVASILRRAGATVTVVPSPSVAVAASLVAAAVGRGDVVVSVGGDGMLSSLVGPVSAADGVLGIVPAGRGNDFARMLGLPAAPADLATVLLAGSTRRVDLLSFSAAGSVPRVVGGSVYAGVDARVAALAAGMHRLPQTLHYPLATLRAITTYLPWHYEVDVDGTAHVFDAATVIVANSGYYGQGMKIAPAASLDDGVLDVIVIAARTKAYLIRSFPKMYDGSHVDLDAITVLTGRRVTLRADGRTPVPVGGDGEPLGDLPPLGTDPAVVEVLPGALTVLT